MLGIFLRMKTIFTTIALLGFSAVSATGQEAKNVILMIADGAGDTTWRAANQFQFGANANTASQYQQRWENDFKQHWMTAFPGHTNPVPPSEFGGLLPPLYVEIDNFPGPGSYDPVRANDATPGNTIMLDNNGLLGRGTPVTLTPDPNLPAPLQALAANFAASLDLVETPGFNGYNYLITNSVTDSAAAGTAFASGVQSYNSAINYDLNQQPVPFLTQQVKALGKAAGVVTTKEFTDATPAAFGSQSPSRQLEELISEQMIYNGLLDVIISPGHPEFGSGGVPRTTPSYSTVSETNLQALRGGVDGWTFVDDAADLTAIGEGTQAAPDRLFGLVPVSSQLHSRDTSARTNAYDPTIYDPSNPNGAVPFVMPDLDVLTQAAINTLSKDQEGFFLMVEGAAVDSAAHANDLPRLIEEQLSFNRAVDQVIEWIEDSGNGSSWQDTLLIITTDHANGLLLGPDSDTIFMQDPVATGVGELPEALWWSTNHTNELIPLWAYGVGSEMFDELGVGNFDPVRGQYFNNSDVYTVMSEVVPEPASLTLLAAGGLLIARRRRAA